jgi:hypothetical protein
MSESKLVGGETEATPDTAAGMSWPRRLAGIGFCLLFVGVIVGAASKSVSGAVPKLLALAGVAVIAIGAIWGIIVFVCAKGKPGA